MRTWPLVGMVIRLRTLSSVDFPAPLCPMIPSISPDRTSNETSLRAQNLPLSRTDDAPPPKRRRGREIVFMISSRNVRYPADTLSVTRYSFERLLTDTARCIRISNKNWDSQRSHLGEQPDTH